MESKNRSHFPHQLQPTGSGHLERWIKDSKVRHGCGREYHSGAALGLWVGQLLHLPLLHWFWNLLIHNFIARVGMFIAHTLTP